MEFIDLPEWAQQATEACADRLSRDGCIRVQLALASRDAGGLRHELLSGWTVCWEVDASRGGLRPDFDAVVVPEDAVMIRPGNTAPARLFPLFPVRWSAVHVGDTITMRDGRRMVGSALVLERIGPTNTHLVGRWPQYSMVRFKADHDSVAAATEGVIVEVYEDGYEIEVAGPDGRTVWLGGVPDELLDRLE